MIQTLFRSCVSYSSMLTAWSRCYNHRGSWQHQNQTASDSSTVR